MRLSGTCRGGGTNTAALRLLRHGGFSRYNASFSSQLLSIIFVSLIKFFHSSLPGLAARIIAILSLQLISLPREPLQVLNTIGIGRVVNVLDLGSYLPTMQIFSVLFYSGHVRRVQSYTKTRTGETSLFFFSHYSNITIVPFNGIVRVNSLDDQSDAR